MAKPAQIQPEARPSAFENTYEAFRALIDVETYAGMFFQELEITQRMFDEAPPRGPLSYVAPPDDDDPPDMKELREQRRQDPPHEERIYWHRLDQYHSIERTWRRAIEKAKLAISAASPELDLPTTPPLQRTTVAVKRSLQRMGGSVPSPMSIGPWPPRSESWVPLLRRQIEEVTDWVNELRLLLIPRSPPLRPEESSGVSPKTEGRQARDRKDPAPPKTLLLRILELLVQRDARSEARRLTAEEISNALHGVAADPKYTRDSCSEMKRQNWLDSRRGSGGGFWVLPEGEKVLRTWRPNTAR